MRSNSHDDGDIDQESSVISSATATPFVKVLFAS